MNPRRWIYRHLHTAGIPERAVASILPGGKHWRVTLRLANGPYTATLPRSPSCSRWEANSRAQLRRLVVAGGGLLAPSHPRF